MDDGDSRGRTTVHSSGRRRGKTGYRAYAVFIGRQTGVFVSWSVHDCASQVQGVRHNSYKGYESVSLAQAAFDAARSRGLTFACGMNILSVFRVAVRVRLLPSDLPLCLAFLDDDTSIAMSGGERQQFWYVVYRGSQPGVYRTYHEVVLATTGLIGAEHKSYREREDAIEAFAEALRGGGVEKFIRVRDY
ncbi:hypothetical protein K523DRAFT_253640 [Schizophyllum commune Tattone D]|nr:hypothetical protein K523DRAFT_253640 [Schizophyllum commune Tattone D]